MINLDMLKMSMGMLVFIGSNNQTIVGQVNNSESFHVTSVITSSRLREN